MAWIADKHPTILAVSALTYVLSGRVPVIYDPTLMIIHDTMLDTRACKTVTVHNGPPMTNTSPHDAGGPQSHH